MKKAGVLLAVLIHAIVVLGQKKFDYSTKVLMNGKEVSMEQFKGKPMVLDLFSQGCVVCFKLMPKMNELKNEVNSKLSIVLLGDDKVKLPAVYEMFKKKFNLSLQAAYSKELFERFYENGLMRYVWVDAAGIIRGKTSQDDMTMANLDAFIREDYSMFTELFLRRKPSENEIILNEFTTSIYRTSFSPRNDSFAMFIPEKLSITEKRPVFYAVNIPLNRLINYAFWYRPLISFQQPDYTELWPFPISDGDTLIDQLLTQRINYGMSFDGYRTPTFLQEVLKSDLKFNYGLEAAREERLMPCWSLQRRDTSSTFLRHQPQSNNRYIGFNGITHSSYSTHQLLATIWSNQQEEAPFVDETGISSLIDIDFRADMLDIADIQKGLATQGLYLVKKNRLVQVIKVTCFNRAIATARLER